MLIGINPSDLKGLVDTVASVSGLPSTIKVARTSGEMSASVMESLASIMEEVLEDLKQDPKIKAITRTQTLYGLYKDLLKSAGYTDAELDRKSLAELEALAEGLLAEE